MNKEREPKSGDIVNLVLADGTPHPATITKVNKNGTVNLKFDHDKHGEGVEIRSAPCDATCKQADSWHFQVEDDKKNGEQVPPPPTK